MSGGVRVPKIGADAAIRMAADYAISMAAPVGSGIERAALWNLRSMVGHGTLPDAWDAKHAVSVAGLCVALADAVRS